MFIAALQYALDSILPSHCCHILLVFISPGVAFEQGKAEGVFHRCSEETMIVMRASQEELSTIVEAREEKSIQLMTECGG